MTAVIEKPVQSIRKQLVVEAPQERAFRVFTEKMNAWWPRTHHVGKSAMKTAVLEPRTGGRWYEVCEDGSECDWGKVLVWEPPRRLVLAWQLSAEYRYDPSLVTEVEVTFTPEGLARTHVEFEHRDLERFGVGAARARASMDGGWLGILQLFAAEAAQG